MLHENSLIFKYFMNYLSVKMIMLNYESILFFMLVGTYLLELTH